MNAAVNSPLEVLAINPVKLGTLLTAAFNSLWPWIVIATAAFSFWRLRSSSAAAAVVSHPEPPPDQETTTSLTSSVAMARTSTTSSSREEEVVLRRGNSIKERLFTVYYDQAEEERENGQENEEEDENDDVDGGDELVVVANVKRIRWGSPSGKGSTAEMRGTGDLGWYCYQDRNVIDGSVVRLWGVERQSCGSPRSYRRRC